MPAKSDVPSSRERLILAATRQIREGNLASVTSRSICREAQVTAPTLYHHFSDMAGLYCAVQEHIFEAGIHEHPDEDKDPLGVIDYVWRVQLQTAEREAGVIDLLNQLLSSGRIPDIMLRTYERLEAAFAILARERPLQMEPRLAAEVYWAAALGICTLTAAAKHGVALPDGASSILREAVLDRIFVPGSDPEPWRTDPVASPAPLD